jgi:PmbA protein
MPDSPAPLLSLEDCRGIFEQVRSAAKSAGCPDVEVIFEAHHEALTRFANNGIHQNVAEVDALLSVRAVNGLKTARAATNRLDSDSIRRAVEQAVALTNAAAPNPELLPLATPLATEPVSRFDRETAAATPRDRALAVAEAIGEVQRRGQVAAGIYSTSHAVEAIFNSAGVEAWHEETMACFAINAIAADSSGWAKASAVALRDLQPAALARTASEKASLSSKPRELEPGRYTVILEPAATLDLVGQMIADFSGAALLDSRSFLNDRLDTQLFGKNIHIRDDYAHPFQSGPSFDGEGVPRQTLVLVDAGVPRQVAWSRISAQRAGAQATGHGFPLPNELGEAPHNIVIQGGGSSIEDLIASTRRGILITRFWYIREVDPYEKILTGMTRDGTFLIEDGRLAGGLKNFRFNQGLIGALNNVEALSPAVRASGEECFDLVAPAMKVHGFHLSEVTRF